MAGNGKIKQLGATGRGIVPDELQLHDQKPYIFKSGVILLYGITNDKYADESGGLISGISYPPQRILDNHKAILEAYMAKLGISRYIFSTAISPFLFPK